MEQLEILKVKARADAAVDEGPGAKAASRLPPASGHHMHRPRQAGLHARALFVPQREGRCEGGEQPALGHAAIGGQQPKLQGIARGVVPGFIRLQHPMPAADLGRWQQKPNQRESRALDAILPTHRDRAAVLFPVPAAFGMGLQPQPLHQGVWVIAAPLRHGPCSKPPILPAMLLCRSTLPTTTLSLAWPGRPGLVRPIARPGAKSVKTAVAVSPSRAERSGLWELAPAGSRGSAPPGERSRYTTPR